MKKIPLVVFLFSYCVFLCNGLASPIELTIDLPIKDVTVQRIGNRAVFGGVPTSGEPGQPNLPVYRATLLLPPLTDLSAVAVSLQDVTETELSGAYEVVPASPPMTVHGPVWPADKKIVQGKDVAVYSNDEIFPKDPIADVSVGRMRNYKLVTVRVSLARYNPVTQKLRTMTSGRIVVRAPQRPPGQKPEFRIPAKFKKMAQRIAVNYGEMAPSYDALYSFTQNTTYVIMTEESIASGSTKFEELVASKESHGFDVQVLNESDWGGGTGDSAADNMRQWIQDNYESLQVEYVLLIGSSIPASGAVPMKEAGSGRATDFYYEQLDDPFEGDSADLFSEVTAGRIPVYDDDISTLDGILTRLIDYENQPEEAIEWRTYTMFLNKAYASDTPGTEMFEAFKAEFTDPAGWPVYRVYDTNDGNPDESSISVDAVVEAWSRENVGLVLWMTHGSPTGASSIMTSDDTADLGSEYPALVFMGSCLNSNIETKNNLAFEALKNTGVGSIGGTETTWYGDAQTEFAGTSTTQGIMYHFTEATTGPDRMSAGDALVYAFSQCTDKRWWINIHGYNLYGMPDLSLFSCADDDDDDDDTDSDTETDSGDDDDTSDDDDDDDDASDDDDSEDDDDNDDDTDSGDDDDTGDDDNEADDDSLDNTDEAGCACRSMGKNGSKTISLVGFLESSLLGD